MPSPPYSPWAICPPCSLPVSPYPPTHPPTLHLVLLYPSHPPTHPPTTPRHPRHLLLPQKRAYSRSSSVVYSPNSLSFSGARWLNHTRKSSPTHPPLSLFIHRPTPISQHSSLTHPSTHPKQLACRFAMGAAEAVATPTVQSLVGNWFPSSIRSRVVSLLASGLNLGPSHPPTHLCLNHPLFLYPPTHPPNHPPTYTNNRRSSRLSSQPDPHSTYLLGGYLPCLWRTRVGVVSSMGASSSRSPTNQGGERERGRRGRRGGGEGRRSPPKDLG